MNFFDPRGNHRPGLLSRLPDWATAAAIPVALGAMAYRGAWPTPAEAVLFGATILCVLGMFHLPSRAARVSSAAAWVLLLIVWGLPTPARSIGVDFRTFYDGAELLYKRGDSPYLAQGTTAFPFPTFPLVWALSLAGRLSSDDTSPVFVLLQSALLAIGCILMDRTARQEALTWHTRIAESYPNSYALSAILVKAVAREGNIPVLQSLPLLMISIVIPLVVCGIAWRSPRRGRIPCGHSFPGC